MDDYLIDVHFMEYEVRDNETDTTIESEDGGPTLTNEEVRRYRQLFPHINTTRGTELVRKVRSYVFVFLRYFAIYHQIANVSRALMGYCDIITFSPSFFEDVVNYYSLKKPSHFKIVKTYIHDGLDWAQTHYLFIFDPRLHWDVARAVNWVDRKMHSYTSLNPSLLVKFEQVLSVEFGLSPDSNFLVYLNIFIYVSYLFWASVFLFVATSYVMHRLTMRVVKFGEYIKFLFRIIF